MSQLFSNIFGSAFQPANAQTSITPRAPFTPQMTQQSVNQQVAGNQRSMNMPALLKGIYDPTSGFSMGPHDLSRATGQLAAGNAANNSIRANQPFQDYSANAQSMLGGQTARENEGLGLANLFGQQQDVGWSQGMNNMQGGMGLLNALFGGGQQ